MRILLLSPLLYYPRCGNGGGVLCFELARRLAMNHAVGLLAFDDKRAADSTGRVEGLAELQAAGIECWVVPRDVRETSRFKAAADQVLLRWPKEAAYFGSDRMRAQLRVAVDSFKPDVVVCQFPYMAQYVRFLGDVPAVMDVQDCFFVSRWRAFRMARGGARVRKLLAWLAWTFYEAEMYPRFSETIALSELDAMALRALCPEIDVSVSRVAVAVCDPTRDVQPVVGFIGNMAHPANADAVGYLLDDIAPRIEALDSSVKIRIAGSHMDRLPTTSLEQSNVELVGFVDDPRVFFGTLRAAVVPLRTGGGVKIKVLEAMAAGVPVISFPVGLDGVPVGEEYGTLLVHDAEEMASVAADLARDVDRSARLGRAAQNAVATQFSWDNKLDAYTAVLVRAVENTGRRQRRQSTQGGRRA